MREELPEISRGPIERLITFEAEKYASERIRRGTRTLNWSGIGALLFVAFLIGALMAALIFWAMLWWPAYIFVVPVGIFCGVGLAASGRQQVYTYSEPTGGAQDPSTSASTAPDSAPATGAHQWGHALGAPGKRTQFPRHNHGHQLLLFGGEAEGAENPADGVGDEEALGFGELDLAFFDAGTEGEGSDFGEVVTFLEVELVPD
ncbi:hypothetical protein ACTWLI_12490 [Arthrobacter sp. Hor0625]|uniref:hypothetical protein n=1 Tax=Arthrobacter sp. Hor0625 TaxID=3457358 RepID=UPI00403E5DAA